MESHKLFTATKPVKLFFFAAVPGAISMLASALYGMIDGIFVGRLLGDTAFAALNLAFPFVIINFAIADLIGVGSSVPISINLGRKNEREAQNIFTCAVIMIVAAGFIIGAALYTAAPSLMRLMGADGEFAALAAEYLRVYALSSPVTTIVFAMDNFLRICGKVRFSMFLNILMSFLSAGLEFLFLFVFKFGIWGAALATCSGMFIVAAIAFAVFAGGHQTLRFVRPEFRISMIKQIIACGSPNFLNNLAGRITSIILNAILVRLGGQDAVSIYGVLMFADGFIQPVMYGTCDSLQPAVGYNWGAGRYSRVRAIEKCCYTAAAVISAVSAAITLLLPEQITALFMGECTPEFMDECVTALRIFSATYLTRWFGFATQSYMIAVEKPVPASLISVSTALIFPVLLLLALWPLGLTGVWFNFAGTSLLAALLSILVIMRQRKDLSRTDQPIDHGIGNNTAE